MDIKAQIDLTDVERDELAEILGGKPSDLAKALAPYATAALREVVSMILGQKVFTRGSDLLEYRLLLMIVHAFNGRIPNEQQVCNLFQTTTSASRSLIRAVMSKYQYQLKRVTEETLKQLIESGQVMKDGSLILAVHSLNLVDEINRKLAEIASNLPAVQKKPSTVATYELQPSSYGVLCKHLHLSAKVPPS